MGERYSTSCISGVAATIPTPEVLLRDEAGRVPFDAADIGLVAFESVVKPFAAWGPPLAAAMASTRPWGRSMRYLRWALMSALVPAPALRPLK